MSKVHEMPVEDVIGHRVWFKSGETGRLRCGQVRKISATFCGGYGTYYWLHVWNNGANRRDMVSADDVLSVGMERPSARRAD
jgi:hypothetical protein